MRNTLTYNIWTKEEENKLKKFVGTMSFKSMVKFFPNRTEISLLKKSIKLGMNSKYKNYKWSMDNNYWKDLDIVKCYNAGFIATDGNLDKKKYIVKFNINIKDISILENIKKDTKFDGNITNYKRKKYNSEDLMHVCSLIIGRAQEWYKDLNKHFNIVPQKTYILKAPNLNNKYLEYAYLQGLIDGDGWIYKRNKKNRITIGLCGASLPLLEWTKDKFNEICKSNCNIHRGKKYGILQNYYYYNVSSKVAAVIIDYFRQFPISRLARKWEKPEVLKIVEEYKKKYPSIFIKLDLNEIAPHLSKSI